MHAKENPFLSNFTIVSINFFRSPLGPPLELCALFIKHCVEKAPHAHCVVWWRNCDTVDHSYPVPFWQHMKVIEDLFGPQLTELYRFYLVLMKLPSQCNPNQMLLQLVSKLPQISVKINKRFSQISTEMVHRTLKKCHCPSNLLDLNYLETCVVN